jgi:3-oxoacyl-[acyl-carrier protein] reductase
MDLDYKGKVALVTGSTKGIGKSIAATLAREGCDVILNGRDAQTLKACAHELGCGQALGDVTTENGARAVLDTAMQIHGRLDVVVCNVGSGTSVDPGLEDEREWMRLLQINLLAATNTVAAARPRLQGSGGVILCISSICGSAALGAPIAYSAAKAALNSFVRGAARYLAPEGIRINALAPGNILFKGGAWERKIASSPDDVDAMLAKDVALRRFGAPEEVAAMAAFLCSSKAAFATGAVYVLDGGQLQS